MKTTLRASILGAFLLFCVAGVSVAQTKLLTIAQPSDMTLNERTTATQIIPASDLVDDHYTFSLVSGPTFVSVATVQRSANKPLGIEFVGDVLVAPGRDDAGTYTAVVRVADIARSDTASFQITVNDVPSVPNGAPVISPRGLIRIPAGVSNDYPITATDPDNDPVTFVKVSGPTFMMVTTTIPGPSPPAAGNIHVAPSLADSGTYAAVVGVSDGSMSDETSFTIEVLPDHAPVLSLIGDMTVMEGATADQAVSASDPDGTDSVSLSFTGPSFMTLVPAEPKDECFAFRAEATIHLEPPLGTVRRGPAPHRGERRRMRRGTFTASVTVTSSNGPTDSQTFTIHVTPAGGGGDVGTRGTFKATVSVVVEKGTPTEREYVRASPNPFNPSTTIAFELAKAGRVTLRVYDVSGRLVSTLAAGDMGAGPQEVRWDATRRNGSRVPSGVYFYVLETPERTVKHDLVVAR